jgi:hypothetical protein
MYLRISFHIRSWTRQTCVFPKPAENRERNVEHTGQGSLSILDAMPAVAVDNVVSLFKVVVVVYSYCIHSN